MLAVRSVLGLGKPAPAQGASRAPDEVGSSGVPTSAGSDPLRQTFRLGIRLLHCAATTLAAFHQRLDSSARPNPARALERSPEEPWSAVRLDLTTNLLAHMPWV